MRMLALVAMGLVLLGTQELQSADKPLPKPSSAPVEKKEPSALEKLLGRHKDIGPTLVESLKDSDPDVREMAANTLVTIGKPAVPALIEGLKADDKDVRANTAYVLGALGAPAQDAMPALLKAMKDDDQEVRRRAAYSVQRLIADAAGSNVAGSSSSDPGLVLPSGTTFSRLKNFLTPATPVNPVPPAPAILPTGLSTPGSLYRPANGTSGSPYGAYSAPSATPEVKPVSGTAPVAPAPKPEPKENPESKIPF